MRTGVCFALLLFCIVITGNPSNTWQKSTGDLHVIAHTLRNDKGEVTFLLFHTAKGFPDETDKAYKILKGKIENGSSTVVFENIPYGVYALGIYHDENSNGKLDETWYGMPEEGIAVSNNPTLGIFNPPRFELAKFNFNTSKQVAFIKLKYL